MKCPHCRVEFHSKPEFTQIGVDADGGWVLARIDCPACKKMILKLMNGPPLYDSFNHFTRIEKVSKDFLVRPKGISRPPCPSEITKEFAEDYIEACLVISDSPKASAALSRRCLQNILREVAKVKPNNLDKEIQQVIDSGTLPSYIIDVIDAIRNIGNFAAHPLKSEKTGEILPVEPMEAEWNLDVLEALFDFYFVQPAVIRKKRAALDQKLKEAGKKPMK
jgi:hypothetical protein